MGALRSTRDVDWWCPEVDELEPAEVAKLEKSTARQDRVRRRESTLSTGVFHHTGAAGGGDEGDEDRPKKMRNPYGRAGKPAVARELEEQLTRLEISKRVAKGEQLENINSEIE